MASRNKFWGHAALQCLKPPTNTLLPFLYRTRTLQRPLVQHRIPRHAVQSHRSFSSTFPTAARQEDAIPFEPSPNEPADDAPSSLDPVLRNLEKFTTNPPEDSTITRDEKATFDRIFRDIAASRTTQPSQRRDEADLDEEGGGGGAYFEDLDQVFDNAIHQQETSAELEAERNRDPVKDHARHRALQSMPGLRHLSDHTTPPSPEAGSEEAPEVVEAREQHRKKVYKLLDNAKTDVEVWAIMEREVFALVRELHARNKEATKRKRNRKTKNQESKSEIETASSSSPSSPAPQPKPSQRAHDTTSPKSLPAPTLLSILQTSYPRYLLHSSRLLRRSFPTSSPYALSILPTVKRLGALSYVLGATVPLYNETLYLHWRSQKDLHAMAELLQEMRNQGVGSDGVTAALLQAVSRRRRWERSGGNGVWRQKWWGVGAVEEGWERVRVGMVGVERERGERALELGAEEGGEEEGEPAVRIGV